MQEFNWFICGLVLGVFATVQFFRAVREKERPYKWLCPEEGCDFKIESNDVGWTDRFATNHERTHADGN